MFFRAERRNPDLVLPFNDKLLFKITHGFRAAVFYILIGLACVINSLVILPLAILGFHHAARSVNRLWAALFLEAGRLICGLDYQVTGLESLPSGPCVILARHESAWETIALQYFLPDAVIVFKDSLRFMPFFGLNLLALQFIPVARDRCLKAFKTVLRLGQKRLAAGRSVVFFPEGTRVAVDAFPEFYRAGAYLAAKAKVPLVPVCHNAGRFLGRNQFIKQPGLIELQFGVIRQAHDATLLNQQAYTWIKAQRANLN